MITRRSGSLDGLVGRPRSRGRPGYLTRSSWNVEDSWKLKRRLGVEGEVNSFDVFGAGTGRVFPATHGRKTLASLNVFIDLQHRHSDAGEIWAMEVLHTVPLGEDASARNTSTAFGGRVSFERERLTYLAFRVDCGQAAGIFATGTLLDVAIRRGVCWVCAEACVE